MVQKVTDLPTMQDTWVQSLGQEDPLEKGKATHSSILAWRIQWTEELSRLQFMESQGVQHDWLTHKGQKVIAVQLLSCVWLFGTPWTAAHQGLLTLHHLPEPTQTHVHWVSDAIQPSHPLSFPSLPAFHLSQHQGLFQWVSSLHQVAKVLGFQLQHQSFQCLFTVDFL